MKLIAAALFFLAPVLAFARAGGAGGGTSSSHSGTLGGYSSSSGGGGGDGDLVGLVFDLVWFLLNAGPVGWVVLVGLAVVVFFLLNQRGPEAFTALPQRPAPAARPAARAASPVAAVRVDGGRFQDAFPGEDFEKFRDKVKTAFLTIQECWSAKELGPMRRFISDGVYQRFFAQFTMMQLLGQSNPMTDVRVNQIGIAKVARDGAYDVIDLMIMAEATDQFTCAKNPRLNTPGGHEPFTEYWSFVRRVDCMPGKDIYRSEACPQCAAPLGDKLMETARCPYCSVYINNGEFDWVLAEITQESDYGLPVPIAGRVPSADPGVDAVRELDPGFSVQQLEDKASNAFLSILTGNATGKPELVRKFCTAEAFEELRKAWPRARIAYDRLYTRTVELLRMEKEGTRATAFVAVRYAYSMVDLDGIALKGWDHSPTTMTKVLRMSRDFSGGTPKGSVYAGSCPSCGAPQKDSLSPTCGYCSQPLNDSRLEWIVEAVLDPAGYAIASKAPDRPGGIKENS